MTAAKAVKVDNPFEPLVRAFEEVVPKDRLAEVQHAFASTMAQAIRSHQTELMAFAAPEPLTEAEHDALLSIGVDPGEKPGGRNLILETLTSYSALVATAVPLGDVAKRLGVNASRLRQRIGERTMLGVRGETGQSWRLPAFQFDEKGNELPGLRLILKAAPDDLEPLQIAAFFDTAQPDLEDRDGAAQSPSEWLKAGGDPKKVAALISDL
jgi:hypothetical protein